MTLKNASCFSHMTSRCVAFDLALKCSLDILNMQIKTVILCGLAVTFPFFQFLKSINFNHIILSRLLKFL